MTIQNLIDSGLFEVVNTGDEPDRVIEDIFCCDLLSIAMSKGIEDAVWVTVMGNINTLAVLSLTDMACIVLAEGASMDAAGMARARQEGIYIFRTAEGIFPAARRVWELLQKG